MDTKCIKTSNMKSTRLLPTRMIQNFHLVWVDVSLDGINNEDWRTSITNLQQVVSIVNTFTDVNECIDFITDIEEQTLVIVSGEFNPFIIQILEDISQINHIYIYCNNSMESEKWVKVRGVFANISSICEAIKLVTDDSDRNAVSISFITKTDGMSNQNLDELDQSFMYTQVLKEIIITIDFEQIHFNEFLTYYREQLAATNIDLQNIEKFENEYRHHEPIWWYTQQYFLYSTVNRALRFMEIDLIIKMGFFIHDLHNHIVALHSEQYGSQHHSNSFIVYRGQGLSQTDFNKLKAAEGGLMSFNNFLSTSVDRAVSLAFADSNQSHSGLVGVLFEININPLITSCPFVNARNISHYQEEEEILFSMHSVFRINQVKQNEEIDGIWQVELTLTDDNDPQLNILAEYIRKETRGITGWDRLGHLLNKLGHFDKAEELYKVLFQQAMNEREKEHSCHMLGSIKNNQGNYPEAVLFYEKSIAMKKKMLTATPVDMATSYNNIGLVYQNMSEYSKALLYYEQALKAFQEIPLANHYELATSYSNIGSVYQSIGQYSKALSYNEQALEVFEKTLPAHHPALANSYNNIGGIYNNIGIYPKALMYYKKAFAIRQKFLPSNHPVLATSYTNIGSVYDHMTEYSKALSYYEQALEIFRKILPSDHPDFATVYNNIGGAYDSKGDHSKALFYYDQVLGIFEKILSANHPLLATTYNNIGRVYDNMDLSLKALAYYEDALKIRQKSLPRNHPDLASSYNNIGGIYANIGEYSKAHSYLERARDILQCLLPPNHPDLETVKENIKTVKMLS